MIYCNGDSFTAGTELVDCEYFKDSYPGLFDKDYANDYEKNNNFKYSEWWLTHSIKKFRSNLTKSKLNELIEKEKEKAWPAKLSKLLNVPIRNSAIMASSLESVVYTTITDILNCDRPIDTVLLQLPPVGRVAIPYMDTFYDATLGHKHYIPEIANVVKVMSYTETDYSLQYKYLFNLTHIYDFCKSNGIKLIIFAVKPDHLIFNPKLEYLKKYFSDDIRPLTMQDELDKLITNVYCPGGHFSERVHDSFAIALHDYIKGQTRCE
jgi:hypothetical protein